MIDGLESQLLAYEDIRRHSPENSVAPALVFNPRPMGFKIPEIEKENVFTDFAGTTLPADQNALAYYSIGELAYLIRTRQITSRELTELFLSRLEKHDQTLHCVISLTR